MSDPEYLDDDALLTLARSKDHPNAWPVLKARYTKVVDRWIQEFVHNTLPAQKISDSVWLTAQPTLSTGGQPGPDGLAKLLWTKDLTPLTFAEFLEIRAISRTHNHVVRRVEENTDLLRGLKDRISGCAGWTKLEPDRKRDIEWAMRVQEGEHGDFNKLWMTHQKSILGFIRARIRPCDEANQIAETILTDTFLALRKSNLRTFDPDLSRFSTFAKRYAEKLGNHFFSGRTRLWQIESSFEIIFDDEGKEKEWEVPDRRPTPGEVLSKQEDWTRQLELMRQMVRSTFALPSPPHQLIVFGLNRLLEWKPRAIVDQLSLEQLRNLQLRLQNDYLKQSVFDSGELRIYFAPLQQRIGLALGLNLDHRRTEKLYADLLDRVTGDVLLRELYRKEGKNDGGKDAVRSNLTVKEQEDLLAKWSGNVWKAVRVQMVKEASQPGFER
jgi:hypothetical protein